jgi:hypothetical protein
MAKLTTEQKETLARWADEGASLNEIQDRLKREFSMTLTYLDTRLLLGEHGISIKQAPKEIPAPEVVTTEPAPPETPAEGGKVTLTVDPEPMPGTMVSGSATFSDGKSAAWYLDQSGQLGLRAAEPGYKPPAADIPVFQAELEAALQRAGY